MRLEVRYNHDRMGMAKDILAILEEYGINLLSIDASKKGVFHLKFEALSFSTLSSLMPKIRKIKSVTDVKTVSFMPSEQEHHALKTLLKTMPELVFSIDAKTNIQIVNESALAVLGLKEKDVINEPINQWIQGFNFCRWISSRKISNQAARVKIDANEYLAELAPIFLPDHKSKNILAGAVIALKSPAKLNKQFNLLQNKVLGFEHILASSKKMKSIIEQAKKMAQLNSPLFITGEIGTGKELMAKACHFASNRKTNLFTVINCENTTEQELFACINTKEDCQKEDINQTQGGTLYLKNIDKLPKNLQKKLTITLEKTHFSENATDENERHSRIICSSENSLQSLATEDSFNQQLYHQLHVLSFHIPALRERKTDIIPLAEMFIEYYSAKLSSSIKRIPAKCRDYLINYPWSGNIGQLKKAIYRALSVSHSQVELSIEMLKLPSENEAYFKFEDTLDVAMKKYEANLLRQLFPAYPSTRLLAKKLGVSHTAIANKLREYQIQKPK